MFSYTYMVISTIDMIFILISGVTTVAEKYW